MSDIDDLLQSVPIDQIAAQLGVAPAEAQAAVEAALPALVGGLEHHAADTGNADTIAAVANPDDPTTLEPDEVVSRAFDGKTDQVASALGAQGVNSDLVKKVLPILVPIVLAWLTKRMGGGATGGAAGGGLLQQILQQVLKGAGQGTSQKAPTGGGSVITDILGSILKGR